MPEYHRPCMSRLVSEVIGASDKAIEKIVEISKENSSFAQSLQRKLFDEENGLDLSHFHHPDLLEEYLIG